MWHRDRKGHVPPSSWFVAVYMPQCPLEGCLCGVVCCCRCLPLFCLRSARLPVAQCDACKVKVVLQPSHLTHVRCRLCVCVPVALDHKPHDGVYTRLLRVACCCTYNDAASCESNKLTVTITCQPAVNRQHRPPPSSLRPTLYAAAHLVDVPSQVSGSCTLCRCIATAALDANR